MNPTRRNLLASSGVLVSVAALGGASPVLAEEATPTPKTKTAGGSDTVRDPFAQLAYQRAVEQKPSTDYVDIRDYGTVVDGGDIGPPLQAALNAIGTHQQQRIRIPKVGSGTYVCSAITFPSGTAFILELDCFLIKVQNTWDIPGGYTVRGMRSQPQNLPNPYGPWVRPRIEPDFDNGFFSIDPTVRLGGQNIWFEHLEVSGGAGKALHADNAELITIMHCMFGSEGNAAPLHFSNVFWAQLENIFAQPKADGSQYAIEFTSDIEEDKNNGIMLCRHFIVTRNGIMFRGVFGPTGVDNTIIDRIHSESQLAGTSLLNFDSTNRGVGQIRIISPEASDALGPGYLIKNVGPNTRNITIDGGNFPSLFDPISDYIEGLVIDNTTPFLASNNMPNSLGKQFAGTPAWGNWQYKTPSAIDAKLLCAPIGLPWAIHTPLNVIQDPASWINAGGATITTGQLAPDGSTMAGRVSGGNGAFVYFQNHTLAVGDYFLAGVWIRSPGSGGVAGGVASLELLGAGGSVFRLNGLGGGDFNNPFYEDRMGDNGWRWCGGAFKVTQIGTNPCEVRFRFCQFGLDRIFFNPSAMLIPASAGVDEVWLINLARSLKGGWPSTAVAGDVSVLDHQPLKAGVFKATAKTFATLPSSPVAGMQAYITDCNTATWGANAAGGGSNKVMVWYNGTNWTVIGK
jgi:hypothetical protein